MNSAPFTEWEGVEAYFTFADTPFAIWLFLIGAVAACIYTIVSRVKHETESYKKLK